MIFAEYHLSRKIVEFSYVLPALIMERFIDATFSVIKDLALLPEYIYAVVPTVLTLRYMSNERS